MTQLLVSVSNIDEAKITLGLGVDIIDLKHPAKGALGALALDEVEKIVRYVKKQDDRKLVTATIGDLPMQPDLLAQAVEALATTDVDIIKIGFFTLDTEPAEDYAVCLEALQKLTQRGVKLVGVLFAEYSYPNGMISMLKHAGFHGVMIDTVHKNGVTLLEYFSHQEILDVVQRAKEMQLQFGLAGSLQLQHIPLIKPFKPDYIGLRGGVCEANVRVNLLSAFKVKAARKLM